MPHFILEFASLHFGNAGPATGEPLAITLYCWLHPSVQWDGKKGRKKVVSCVAELLHNGINKNERFQNDRTGVFQITISFYSLQPSVWIKSHYCALFQYMRHFSQCRPQCLVDFQLFGRSKSILDDKPLLKWTKIRLLAVCILMSISAHVTC